MLVGAEYQGQSYLVSILGEGSEWVRNVRAAGGKGFVKRGQSRPVRVTEVPFAERGPILKAYCQVATSGRQHFPVPPRCAAARVRGRGGALPCLPHRPGLTKPHALLVLLGSRAQSCSIVKKPTDRTALSLATCPATPFDRAPPTPRASRRTGRVILTALTRRGCWSSRRRASGLRPRPRPRSIPLPGRFDVCQQPLRRRAASGLFLTGLFLPTFFMGAYCESAATTRREPAVKISKGRG